MKKGLHIEKNSCANVTYGNFTYVKHITSQNHHFYMLKCIYPTC